ncbi:MAG: hypothetical protein AAGC80_21735 [Rhodococcus sp. (in: high G+C Gram-positive bacteria)]
MWTPNSRQAVRQNPEKIATSFGRKDGEKMWNRQKDDDILDFALLWEPLGGPAPENIAAAFSIDLGEYRHRLRGAVMSQLDRLRKGIASPERVYGLAAITAFDQDLHDVHAGGRDRCAVSATASGDAAHA